MPKAMIITVGVGETVSHGICCAIRQQNPEYIMFLLTKASKEKNLPLILNNPTMNGRRHEEMILNNENDIEEIKFECEKVIDELVKRHIEPRDITIDYTSGTKAMSAGVVLAGLDKRIGTLVYVSGKRDKNGRVSSGTERVIAIEPNRTYAEWFLKEAVNSFNSCQFDGCLQLINQAKPLMALPEFQSKIELLENLAKGYSLWDRFDLKQAFSTIDSISKSQLLGNWGIKSRIEKNKECLHREIKNKFCLERAIDLLENAKRRGNIEQKYDDAVARLYRCMEYIAQLKIAQKDLYIRNEKGEPETNALDIDKLPPEFKGKYSRYKDEKECRVKLGLYQNYELLFDLKDEAGRLFMKEYERGELKQILSSRNDSILAHGFNPISVDAYKNMLTTIEEFVRNLFPGVENIIEKVRFPAIKI